MIVLSSRYEIHWGGGWIQAIANAILVCHAAGVMQNGIVLRLIVAVVMVSAHCAGCAMVFPPPVSVGPEFRVRVENDGRPVEGLRVVLGIDGRISSVTDKDGIAIFSGVRPGTYYVLAGHAAGLSDIAKIEVKRNGRKSVLISGQWPREKIIAVKSLKGTIRAGYAPGTQPKLNFDLFEGVAGRKLDSFQTNAAGEFDTKNAAPGLYFLNLKPSGVVDWGNEAVTGQIIVAVRPEASADHLDIDLGYSSCGLSYAEASQCPESELRMTGFAGQVLDPAGATIGDARIFLLDSSKTPVEQLRSDKQGKFTSSIPKTGTFQLEIASLGFTPLRRTLHLETTAISQQSFTAVLGLMGSCSNIVVP